MVTVLLSLNPLALWPKLAPLRHMMRNASYHKASETSHVHNIPAQGRNVNLVLLSPPWPRAHAIARCQYNSHRLSFELF